ncbi:hypothetical protein AUO94_13675 [Planococcus kocurii]|uniref:DUF6680 domain-containing protein n=1 Tax=Planococcus kocurii TaxID=1374 RepID=A0ABM5WZ34_9BACL|nr:DUF6680 family protein [Planococcus kocurii]ALS79610.1 hypothetical protein AUO94_13675 [Planococcus kocurii]
MEWAFVIIPSLLSGIIGVGISSWYHKRSEKRRQKYIVLEQLIGNRYDLSGEKFSEALNKIFIVFNDSKDVLIALKAFHESIVVQNRESNITDQRLMELFKALCKDLDINTDILTDSFYLQAFNNR